MLVLSRKSGQEIVIGRDVSIRVLEIHGKCVRMGITAPRAVAIHREEVVRRIVPSRKVFDLDAATSKDATNDGAA